jgi:hypothetical protein
MCGVTILCSAEGPVHAYEKNLHKVSEVQHGKVKSERVVLLFETSLVVRIVRPRYP